MARKGDLPDVHDSVSISVNLMSHMVAVMVNPRKDSAARNNEMLMLNVATATSVSVTRNAEKDRTDLNLRLPICADKGQRISLSRRIGSRWRLIGYGTIE